MSTSSWRRPNLSLSNLGVGCIVYLPPFGPRPDGSPGPEESFCTCCPSPVNLDSEAYNHSIVVMRIEPASLSHQDPKIYFLPCSSHPPRKWRQQYSPIGVIFDATLRGQTGRDINDEGRAWYWLEGGKCMSLPTSVRIQHVFVLPFTSFKLWDDSSTPYDYRLNKVSYGRLLTRAKLPLTELDCFIPTEQLRRPPVNHLPPTGRPHARQVGTSAQAATYASVLTSNAVEQPYRPYRGKKMQSHRRYSIQGYDEVETIHGPVRVKRHCQTTSRDNEVNYLKELDMDAGHLNDLEISENDTQPPPKPQRSCPEDIQSELIWSFGNTADIATVPIGDRTLIQTPPAPALPMTAESNKTDNVNSPLSPPNARTWQS